ncbi:MAG: TonB-dependent receptor, partial [Pedobacter sp.]
PITSYKNITSNPFATYTGYFNHYGLNPYVALDNWRRDGKVDNVLSNLDLSFKATNDLSFTWRIAANIRNRNEQSTSKGQVAVNAPNTNTPIPASVGNASQRYYRLSSEVFGRWDKKFNDFRVGVLAGTYVRDEQTTNSSVGATNLVVPELYTISNGVGGVTGSNSLSKRRMVSVFGSANFNYKGWANVEFTARNDWASVFDESNRSFFYPGVNASLVLSDAIPGLKTPTFSFFKVSASVTKTANADIGAYNTASTFSGTGAGFPYNIPGYTANNSALNPLLKPEFINSKEVGLQLGFLRDRILIEASAYHQDNTNQIINVQVSNATGYTGALVNAASFVNKGVELDLKLNPLVNLGNVAVNFKVNGTYNNSEIKSIYEGLDRLAIGGFATASNYAIVGNPAFVFLANDYTRDSLGRVIVSSSTGLPTANTNLKQYGRTAPLWIVGLTPSVSYKNLTLSVVGEYRGGHYAYSGIGSAMAWTGVSAATAQNNRERFVFPNSSYLDGSGKYVANTNVTINDANNFYTGVYRTVTSNFLHSADSWRIREVSLGYEFPSSVFKGQNVIKGLNVTVNARNLFLWVPESNQFTDPDFNFTTGNTTGISTSQINPPTRMIGFNITATF